MKTGVKRIRERVDAGDELNHRTEERFGNDRNV
jgi:hypothetical protein